MGKASRAKRERNQSVYVDPAVAAFNEAFGDGDEAVLIDGVMYRGKKKIREVYQSWVRNAINLDQLEHLGAIAEMGQLMHSKILFVGVEIIDQSDGLKRIVNPLAATFMLDKEQLFLWFLEYACDSAEGKTLVSMFAGQCGQIAHHFDRSSTRGRMLAKLFAKAIEILSEKGLDVCLAAVERLASGSEIIADELRGFKARTEADRERKSLMEEFGMRPDPDKCECNPEEVSMPQGEVLPAHMSHTGNLSQGRRSMSL